MRPPSGQMLDQSQIFMQQQYMMQSQLMHNQQVRRGRAGSLLHLVRCTCAVLALQGGLFVCRVHGAVQDASPLRSRHTCAGGHMHQHAICPQSLTPPPCSHVPSRCSMACDSTRLAGAVPCRPAPWAPACQCRRVRQACGLAGRAIRPLAVQQQLDLVSAALPASLMNRCDAAALWC